MVCVILEKWSTQPSVILLANTRRHYVTAERSVLLQKEDNTNLHKAVYTRTGLYSNSVLTELYSKLCFKGSVHIKVMYKNLKISLIIH